MEVVPIIKYIIISDDGYWSNETGWCEDKESATIFDHTGYRLPVVGNKGVRWEKLVYTQ